MSEENVELLRRLEAAWNAGDLPNLEDFFDPEDIEIGGLMDFRDGKILRWEDFGSREKALAVADRP